MVLAILLLFSIAAPLNQFKVPPIMPVLSYRLTSLLAGASMGVGVAWGALSADMTSLLVSRVIEGVGTTFMAVLAPAVIALWFRPRRRGAAMGIWST